MGYTGGVWIGWSLVKEAVVEQSAVADWQDLLNLYQRDAGGEPATSHSLISMVWVCLPQPFTSNFFFTLHFTIFLLLPIERRKT